MIDKKKLGTQIRIFRHNRGWTQQQLANEFGCSQANISDMERGDISIDLIDLERLADILKVSLYDFFPSRASQPEHLETEVMTIVCELPTRTQNAVLTMLRALATRPVYSTISESTPCYHTDQETQILEIIRRMDLPKQEQAIEILLVLEQNTKIRIIGDPGQNETPDQEDRAA